MSNKNAVPMEIVLDVGAAEIGTQSFADVKAGLEAAVGKMEELAALVMPKFFENPLPDSVGIVLPSVPQLAKGAVLPANKPFLAMVGDQKNGTNVEAPLATIQEAVAVTMEDMIAGNMAGHEATVAVLREILSAVLGIHVGDDVIGQAAARYNAKMAVVRGGV